jgi:signal peptidase I
VRIGTRFQRTAIAVLWSLPLTGLGQLYNGQPRRALSFCALGLVIKLAVLAAVISPLPYTLAGLVAILAGAIAWVLLRVIALGDAAAVARRADPPVRRYNRWYVLLAVAIASLAGAVALDRGLGLGNRRSVAAYHIPGPSMRPTIAPGDFMVARRNAYGDRPPRRGDLIVFRLPEADSDNYVKRVVGLPGDRVQIAAGRLRINGQTAERTRIGGAGRDVFYIEKLPDGHRHRIIERSDDAPLDDTKVYLVPPGHYFVLGDNRDNSGDSRILDGIGYVPAGMIRDRPLYILWSGDPARIGLRLR